MPNEATYYPKEVMAQVKEASDIVAVISEITTVTKAGPDIIAQCPFCKKEHDKSGMIAISASKQLFVCLDCGANGDVFSFVTKYLNASLREATEYLAKRAGVNLPAPRASKLGKKERETILTLNREAALFFVAKLNDKATPAGADYLRERGISKATARKFGLGYAPSGQDELYQHLLSKGYTLEQMKQAELVGEYRGAIHDKFRNRLMCPVVTPDRQVVGFSGRILGDGKPKYKNSTSSLVFDKKATLFGLNHAQHSQRNEIILCEGNLDVISMHQAGFDNTVASLGTAFSKEQASIIAKYADTVHLLYDSDEPGVKATLSALPILRDAGLSVDIVHLGDFKDPDEFLKSNSPQELDARLSCAEDSYLFEIRKKYGQYNVHDEDQKREMLIQFGSEILSKPMEIKNQCIAAMQKYIEHYDEVLNGTYQAKAKDSERISVVAPIENASKESHVSVAATRSVPQTRVDVSWLKDCTIT